MCTHSGKYFRDRHLHKVVWLSAFPEYAKVKATVDKECKIERHALLGNMGHTYERLKRQAGILWGMFILYDKMIVLGMLQTALVE